MRPGVAPVKIRVLKEGEVAKVQPFAVQVGAFENERSAENLKKRLERKYPSVVVQAASEERTLYRVRIAEPDIEAANKTASELRKQDLKPFVVRMN